MAIGAVTALVVAGAVALGLGKTGSTDEALLDVRGQTVADAIAVLQDRGLSTRVEKRTHPTVPAEHVIATDPVAGTAVAAGSEITIEASTGAAVAGPEGARLEVPDVSSLTYVDAVRTLTNAGFRQFRQAYLPSSPESKDRVLATNPPARRLAEGTAPITVVMGSGPAVDHP